VLVNKIFIQSFIYITSLLALVPHTTVYGKMKTCGKPLLSIHSFTLYNSTNQINTRKKTKQTDTSHVLYSYVIIIYY